MLERSRPDVFAYLDYRHYLRDYYDFGKASFRLSYRGLARKVGVRSPSFLKLVMEGARNLSPGTARRVAKACSLKGDSVEFFVCLVRMNQAETNEEREAAYRKLHHFEQFRRAQHLDVARDAYYAHWYIPAIREMVASPHFREDAEWIAHTLRPQIRPAQARKALRTLEKLGLLERDAEGHLHQTDQVVTSGPQTGTIHMIRFLRTMMDRGSGAIDEFPREERDISSITLCVDAAGFEKLKERIQELRRELLLDEQLAEGDSTRVVQLNFQLFPLTEPLGTKK